MPSPATPTPPNSGQVLNKAPDRLGDSRRCLTAQPAYWMVLPAVVLGLVAVIVGVIARRRAALGARARYIATVAVCLGAVAMLFTPVVIMHTSAAEDWGRDCALHPEQDKNCPEASR